MTAWIQCVKKKKKNCIRQTIITRKSKREQEIERQIDGEKWMGEIYRLSAPPTLLTSGRPTISLWIHVLVCYPQDPWDRLCANVSAEEWILTWVDHNHKIFLENKKEIFPFPIYRHWQGTCLLCIHPKRVIICKSRKLVVVLREAGRELLVYSPSFLFIHLEQKLFTVPDRFHLCRLWHRANFWINFNLPAAIDISNLSEIDITKVLKVYNQ